MNHARRQPFVQISARLDAVEVTEGTGVARTDLTSAMRAKPRVRLNRVLVLRAHREDTCSAPLERALRNILILIFLQSQLESIALASLYFALIN